MVSLRAGEDGSHCLGHLAHRHQCHGPCTTLRCWRPLAPTCPGSRPGHSDACRCRQGVLHLSSHQRHSTNRRNAGGTQSRRPISPSFGGPVLGVEWPSCLVPKDTCFPGHAQKRWRGKGGGSTFVITMVQLASSRPPRLQTGVTSPPATEANMPRELHLHLPGSPEKGSHSLQLTGQHSFQYFAGTFRMQKTLKSHQSPCQAEPLAHLPLLSIHCQRAHQTHGQALRIQKTNSTLL